MAVSASRAVLGPPFRLSEKGKVHMRKVLVTGGAGFIGSHVVDRLLADGWHVTAVDNFDPFYDRATKLANILPSIGHPNFRFCYADVCADNLGSLLAQGRFEAIVHLAAKAGVRPSIVDPGGHLRVNVGGTAALLELARQRGVRQFVLASSSSVYGANPRLPWSEADYDLRPISPYAQTKISAESLGHVYSHLYGIRFLALRFFTVYGPRQRPDLAIHKFAGSMVRGEPITIFGSGTTCRDYTYVGDVVKGISAALEYADSMYEVFNLGSGRTVDLLQMVATLEQSFGLRALLRHQPEQPGDVRTTYANIDKAQRMLGYEPASSLAFGMSQFAEWFRAHSALQKDPCEEPWRGSGTRVFAPLSEPSPACCPDSSR
jgi:UDP-glucuronate 4-epimerase